MATAKVPVTFSPVDSKKVDAALARIQSKAKGVDFGGGARSIDKLSRPLGKITGQASEFQKSLEASNARVLAFGASVAVINKLSQAFGALVSNTIKVEATFAKINTILGGTNQELQKFGDGIFKVAQQTGTSFDQVAEGALELARQGLGVEQSLQRVSTSLKLVRVAGIDSEKAVAGLTAAIKGFEGAGLTVAQIADKLAEVDTKFAVSTEDLINGLERASASARVAGVSFDELIGVITTVQERTQRGGAVIGNAFKTIFARLGRTDTLQTLEKLGIEVLDAQGNVRSAIPLFTELATELDKLGLKSVEAGEIIQKVAGVRQRDILISLVEDLNSGQSQFAKSLQVSAGAAGALDAKNEKLNQTLEALINNLTVGGQKLASVLGEIGFTDAASDILKTFSTIVNGITDILQGDSIGAKFAQGLVKGIGSVLTGPGLALIGAIFVKLFVDLAKFGVTSLKQILGINRAAEQQKILQQSVLQTLLQNENIQREILALEGNKVAQEQLLLKIYNQQAAALARVQKAAATVTPGLFRGGFRGGEGGVGKTGRGAGGYVAAEARDVSRGVGGAPANSKVVSIPNFAFGSGKRGTMVANSSEYFVPNYAGGGDAIFNKNMVKAMGLPSGARKINAAGGFIPNFVKPQVKLGDRTDINTREQAKAAGYTNAAISKRFGKGKNKSRRTTYDVNLNEVLGSEMPAMLVPSGGGFGSITRANIPGFKDARATGKFQAYAPNFGSMEKLEQEMENKFGQKSIEKFAGKEALGLARNIASAFALKPVEPKEIAQVDGVKGFISSAVGAFGGIFDAALTTALRLNSTDEKAGGDFDVDLTKSNIGNIQKVFGKRSYPRFIDNKINANQGASMFDKTKKTPTLMQKVNDAAFDQGRKLGFIRGANGYIPNFAGGGLDEAIAREQSAGLPINQIRINQSGKLRSAQNPMGLAVTNTRDEPNGAIPNFARKLSSKQLQAGFGGKAARDTELARLAGSADEASGALDGSITKIFALQLATSALTSTFAQQGGKMEEFGNSLSGAINTMLVLSTVGASPLGVFGKGGGGLKGLATMAKSTKGLTRVFGILKGVAGPVALGLTGISVAMKLLTGKGLFQTLGEGLGILANETQLAAQKINEAGNNLGKGTEGKDVTTNLKSFSDAILAARERAGLVEKTPELKGASESEIRLAGIIKQNPALQSLPLLGRSDFGQSPSLRPAKGFEFDPSPKSGIISNFNPDFGNIDFKSKDRDIVVKRLEMSLFKNANEIIDGLETGIGKPVDPKLVKGFLESQDQLVATFFEDITKNSQQDFYGEVAPRDIKENLDKLNLALKTKYDEMVAALIKATEEEDDTVTRVDAGEAATQIALAASRRQNQLNIDGAIREARRAQVARTPTGSVEKTRTSFANKAEDLDAKAAEARLKIRVDLIEQAKLQDSLKGIDKEKLDIILQQVNEFGSIEEIQKAIGEIESLSLKDFEEQVRLAKVQNTQLDENLTTDKQILEIRKLQALETAKANKGLAKYSQKAQQDLIDQAEDLPNILATNLENSLNQTFKNLANGAYDTIGDAFLQIAFNFGQELQNQMNQRMAKQATDALFGEGTKGGGLLGGLSDMLTGGGKKSSGGGGSGGGGGFFSGFGDFFNSSKNSGIGGKIGGFFGYNSGGLVSGGSGVRDDIPAALTGGEYVIKKSAVQKYGKGFLDQLNSNSIYGMQEGGILGRDGRPRIAGAQGDGSGRAEFFTPGTRGAGTIQGKEDLLGFAFQQSTSGATDIIRSSGSGASINLEDQSAKLTTFGRFRESPARKSLKQAQEQAYGLYLTKLADEKRARDARKQRSNMFKQAVMGSFVSAGVSAAFGGLGKLFQKAPIKGTTTTAADASFNKYLSSTLGGDYDFGPTQAGTTYDLGAGQTYTPTIGGGGSSFMDPYDFGIPGESNAFSSQFSSQANGGAIASNTNALLMGGEYVLSSAAASRIGRSNLDDINMGRYSNGGPVGAGISDSSSSGGGVGEVNITINMEKGDASVDENSNGDADPTQTKEFAKRIKDVVVGVINEEKRVSGSLFTRRK